MVQTAPDGNDISSPDDWGNNFQAAQKLAREMEDKAAKAPQDVDEAEQARLGENGFFYSGKGLQPKLSSVRGKKVKKGPIAFIVGLVISFGALTLGAQSLLPFSLVSQFQELFDSMKPVSELRSNSLLMRQIDGGYTKNPFRVSITGKKSFAVTKKQAAKLKQQGIEIGSLDKNGKFVASTDGFGHTKGTVFKFDDGSGVETLVAPTKKLAGQIDSSNRVVMSIQDAFKIDDFNYGFRKGSRTWRGSVGAWFGQTTLKFLQSNNLTRNRFAKFQERLKAEAEGNSRRKFISQMIKNGMDDLDIDNGTGKVSGGTNEVDKDGKIVGQKKGSFQFENNDAGKAAKAKEKKIGKFFYRGTEAEMSGVIKSKVSSTMEKASSIGGAAVNLGCTALNVLGSINVMVAGHTALQTKPLANSHLEAYDKTRSGDGDNSPTHDLVNTLTEPADTYDDEGRLLKTGTTGMSSEALASIYERRSANQKDRSLASFNLYSRYSEIFGKLGGFLGVAAASFTSCAVARMAVAGVGAITDLLTGGISKGFMKIAGTAIFATTVAGITSTLVQAVTPIAFRALSRDLTEIVGEDLGNGLVLGAEKYISGNHQFHGGSLASKEKYEEFAMAQQDIIAKEAEFERATRSPFDATSQYTFMGSLARQLALISSKNGFWGIMSSLGNITRNAVSGLFPQVSAVSAVANTTYGDCHDLESIGAVGDAFCQPYIISDLATIEDDPDEVVNYLLSKGEISEKEGGGFKIEEEGDLAKYIKYCNKRQSPFGIVDQNFANDFAPLESNGDNGLVNTVVNSVVGAIPVLGDAVDIVNSADQLSHGGWIDGSACVSGGNFDKSVYTLTPTWEESKYFQRFLEDQSLASEMGIIEDGQSALVGFLDEHDAGNPQDNSYEAMLARASGLTLAQVEENLDFIAYQNSIAEYTPPQLDRDSGTSFGFAEQPVDSISRNLAFFNFVSGSAKTRRQYISA